MGLDTLRALGVSAVVGYHLQVPFLSGGFLGVTLFFVVSGFLITHLLLSEVRRTTRIDVLGFWKRRARRLLPAAYLVITVCLVWAAAFRHELLPRLRPDALAALLYGNNWWMVFHDTSYFDSFGLPSPLTHFWSLAVEEQFYLAWPVLLVVLLAWSGRRARSAMWVGALALASTAAMFIGYLAGSDPNRLYLGTDTRAAELLAGATLAMALHLAPHRIRRVSERLVPYRFRRIWPVLVFGPSLVLLTVLMTSLRETASFTYLGGLALGALASVGLVASVSRIPGIGAVDHGWVGAIGRRSYAIYLWHFPVLVAVSTATDYGRFTWSTCVQVVLLTLLLAELTFRFVENPVRRYGFRGSLRRLWVKVERLAVVPRLGVAFAVAVPAILTMVALTGHLDPAPVDHGPSTVRVGVVPGSALAGSSFPSGGPTPIPSVGPTPAPVPKAKRVPPSAPSRLTPMSGTKTVAVGDSLMIDVSGALQRALPGISIDAEVGRQPWTGLEVAQKYRQFNRPDGTYVLGIGTNGAIDARSLTAFCQAHSRARVVLITPRVPRSWEATSVAAIRRAADRCPNVRVVDFHKLAAGRSGWFAADGVHLTPAGVSAMSSAIVRAGRT